MAGPRQSPRSKVADIAQGFIQCSGGIEIFSGLPDLAMHQMRDLLLVDDLKRYRTEKIRVAIKESCADRSYDSMTAR